MICDSTLSETMTLVVNGRAWRTLLSHWRLESKPSNLFPRTISHGSCPKKHGERGTGTMRLRARRRKRRRGRRTGAIATELTRQVCHRLLHRHRWIMPRRPMLHRVVPHGLRAKYLRLRLVRGNIGAMNRRHGGRSRYRLK